MGKPMDDMVNARLRKAARSQSLLRALNERINSSRQPSTFIEFLCECASTSCGGVIALTEDEYESVRADPTHFLVAPGHVFPAVDRIVEQDRRFLVVEKINHAAEFATAADPRSTS
jgi:hypothetical protein